MEWLNRMRRAVVLPSRSQLNGEVEVDETFGGGVKTGKRGLGAAGKPLVLIAAKIHGVRIARIRLAVILPLSTWWSAAAMSFRMGSQATPD